MSSGLLIGVGAIVALFVLWAIFRPRGEKDINTVTGGPPRVAAPDVIPQLTPPGRSEPHGASQAGELERLWGLHQAGALTAPEFEAAKAEVLAGRTSGVGVEVVLTHAGPNLIAAIKTMREVRRDMGLKEAKDAVEAAPYLIADGVDAGVAETVRQAFAAVGATVEVR